MKIFDHTGKKYGTFTVIEMIQDVGRKKYKIRCDCGLERIIGSNHLLRPRTCIHCMHKKEIENHIGERNGNISCIGYVRGEKCHNLRVKCDCGHEYTMASYSQFKETSSCYKCRGGFHPGKIIGNATLIESFGNNQWVKKCICGTTFVGNSRKKDCGCIRKSILMKKNESKIGNTYEYLTVKKIVGIKDGHILLLVKCKCGNELVRHSGHEFKSASCGCRLAVPTGEKANKATLKDCEVRSMRELYEYEVYPLDELSKMFNKPISYIKRIIKKQIWKHV